MEKLRSACREFLTSVELRNKTQTDSSEFQPALVQLRAAFLEVANHAAAVYRIPPARELANEMAKHRDAETFRLLNSSPERSD